MFVCVRARHYPDSVANIAGRKSWLGGGGGEVLVCVVVYFISSCMFGIWIKKSSRERVPNVVDRA